MKNESIKNLKDVLKENLRLLNVEKEIKTNEDKKNPNNSVTKEILSSKTPSSNRILVTEDELDVTLVDLKSYDPSKKFLRKIRKILHTEIRDWVLFPFQKKQTKFNLKTIQNIEKIYSELDGLYYKSDTTFAELYKKIEKANAELEEVLLDSNAEFSKRLDNTNTEINQKIDTANTELTQKIEKEISFQNKIFEIESSIRKYYEIILERPPDEQEIRYYLFRISKQGLKIDDVDQILRNSSEYRKLQEGKIFLEKYRQRIKKPIFIFGVPRTGTTLLHSILCAHDQLAWFSNQDIKNWITDLEHYQIYDYYKWLKSAKKKIPMNEEALLVFGKRLGSGLKQFGHPPKGTTKIPIEGEIFWRKYFGSEYVKDISIDKKILLAKDLLETIENQSKTRFVCKAPNNSMRLFAIQKIFPDAQFINIIRDPRAVVNSMLQRYKEEGKFQPNIQIKNMASYANLDLIGKFSTLYKEVTESIYEFMIKNPDNLLNIKYDDLLREPFKEVNKVIKFCDLEERNPKEIMPPLRKNTNEKWKKNLTKEDQKRIFEIVEPALEKMNYPYKL